MNKKLKRFLKYSAIGVSTFIIDLSILWFLTDVAGVYYLLATLFAFLVGVTINYFASRHFVFKGTSRGVKKGYEYFLGIVSLGVILTLSIMYVLVNFTQLNILEARIITSGFIGIFNFLMNDTFNFKIKDLSV
ncbi:MAG: GtrA family protein [Patescibacteria group bacterium]